mmetsp:Transcript_31439/g.60617  ORF Transcript_31439/g.60617 Transcript_31439/m.60617 type:complete len:380 (-) Transcript_31439:192-1331(-)|eukprot:CAMPEP_0114231214 /NCGR_PEP_ID=MMETSP0058-20121206/3911_1 /TAXON_ID=36894 /ORGANISM="Pyramimonas parkeae, CCMP726" /LENGTH=379 /DNA_ID=CAMNT_0001342521 /DNA_START=69 /DNA_END=1208 /DNA_ORIENTATION=-
MGTEWRVEAAAFAGMVLGTEVPGEKEEDFHQALLSGVQLCRMLNTLVPNTVLRFKESKMPFVMMENISAYIDGCRRVGVPEPELFITADLYEARNISSVVKNLMALKRIFGKTFKPSEAAPTPEPLPNSAILRNNSAPKHMCRQCGKTIYQMELLRALQADWHKNCFRCSDCNLALNPEHTEVTHNAKYCKRCFDQRFVEHKPEVSPLGASKWSQKQQVKCEVVKSVATPPSERKANFFIPFNPVHQTCTTPEKGDALRACVAAILALEISNVPNFIEDPRGYLPALQEWLRPHRYAFMKVPLADGALPFALHLPGATWCYCILAGPSPRGPHKHCVVGKIVGEDSPAPFHDPFPAGGMLAGPAEWCGVLMALAPEFRG